MNLAETELEISWVESFSNGANAIERDRKCMRLLKISFSRSSDLRNKTATALASFLCMHAHTLCITDLSTVKQRLKRCVRRHFIHIGLKKLKILAHRIQYRFDALMQIKELVTVVIRCCER